MLFSRSPSTSAYRASARLLALCLGVAAWPGCSTPIEGSGASASASEGSSDDDASGAATTNQASAGTSGAATTGPSGSGSESQTGASGETGALTLTGAHETTTTTTGVDTDASTGGSSTGASTSGASTGTTAEPTTMDPVDPTNEPPMCVDDPGDSACVACTKTECCGDYLACEGVNGCVCYMDCLKSSGAITCGFLCGLDPNLDVIAGIGECMISSCGLHCF